MIDCPYCNHNNEFRYTDSDWHKISCEKCGHEFATNGESRAFNPDLPNVAAPVISLNKEVSK